MLVSLFQLFCWTGNWKDKKWSVLAQPLPVCWREQEEKEEGGGIIGRLGCRTALVELVREAGVVVVSRLKQLE